MKDYGSCSQMMSLCKSPIPDGNMRNQSLITTHTDPSKFLLVRSVWNRLKIREIYIMGQYQTLILYISAGNYNSLGNFWQGPLLKDTLFENGTKSHNFLQVFISLIVARNGNNRIQFISKIAYLETSAAKLDNDT